MKAAIYLRVSTEDQAEKYGLDSQRRVLTEFCKARDWPMEFFVDAGASGKSVEGRPEFQRLLKAIETRGRFDVILASEQSRFARDVEDWNRIRKLFAKAGVMYGGPDGIYDPASPEHTFTSNVKGSMNQYEREQLLIRTSRGRSEAVRSGKYFAANSPFGYRSEDGFLHIHEPEAEIVRRIFTMASNGNSLSEVARRLAANNIPSPMALRRDPRGGKQWRVATLARILRAPIYKGTASWGKRRKMVGDVIAVAVPKIVEADVWEIVQQKLS